MKRQIRCGVFETNSSSTHSLTMALKSDYDRWKNEGLFLFKGFPSYFDSVNKPEREMFYTKEECKNFAQQYRYNNYWDYVDWDNEDVYIPYLIDLGFYNFDYENECLEPYYGEFKTPSGEVVVAFGEYGFAG